VNNPQTIRFFMILGVLNGALLTIGIWTGVFSFLLFILTVPLSVLCLLTIERAGSLLGNILAGWTPGTAGRYDRYAADLARARHSKRSGHFDEALLIVNEVIHRAPEFPDALYLKAHILWDGFGNAEAAKSCLKKVKALVPKGEPLHRWALNYDAEVTRGIRERQ
jgi:tetratricopeptide (TPR) repeat protein